MFLLKYFVLIIFAFVEINGDYCYTNDDNPYLRFSTKTAYHVTRGSASAETTCKPIQIWMLIRHGTRIANTKDLLKMKKATELRDILVENYESGNAPSTGALCLGDYLAIKNWQWNSSVESQGSFLNEQGWKDLFTLAQRYNIRYPAIFGGSYNPEDFYFRHTLTQRTQESCKAFVDGLFGNGSHNYVIIETPLENDEIIKPYEKCNLWNDKVHDNPDTKEEMNNLRKSDDYIELLEDITNRMGLKKFLKHDDIDIMYDNCRFDKTRYLDKISPWCAMFTKKQLTLMEYYQDLGRFYKTGYGHEMHPKLGCMPLKHLLETFIKTISNSEGKAAKPKLIAMFSHDSMLDMFFTALGFGKDQDLLKGLNYNDHMVNRKYSASKNTPFGANVVAVLHECGPDEDEKFKVQFFLNERQMMIPGCDRGLCSWKYLQQTYASALNCNIDFCNKNSYVV